MQKRPGFTILELMVVLAIICVLALSTGPPIHRWLEERGVQEAAVQLAELMQRTKLIAMRNSTNCTINILANDLYIVATNNPPNFEIVWLEDYRGRVLFTNDPGTGAAPPFQITFTPQGTATVAGGLGSIVLTSTANSIRQQWLRIRVSAAGGISIHRWNTANNAWFVVT